MRRTSVNSCMQPSPPNSRSGRANSQLQSTRTSMHLAHIKAIHKDDHKQRRPRDQQQRPKVTKCLVDSSQAKVSECKSEPDQAQNKHDQQHGRPPEQQQIMKVTKPLHLVRCRKSQNVNIISRSAILTTCPNVDHQIQRMIMPIMQLPKPRTRH